MFLLYYLAKRVIKPTYNRRITDGLGLTDITLLYLLLVDFAAGAKINSYNTIINDLGLDLLLFLFVGMYVFSTVNGVLVNERK